MDVEIISKEFIKPSSSLAISNQFEPFRLSLLDQIFPTYYFPIILFYPATNALFKGAQISTQLKTSLSQTLSTFYPFSGRLKANLVIDSYEEGVPYIESRVKGCLSEFLRHPQLELLNQLLPCQPFSYVSDPEAAALVAVQVNKFDCGGIALGLCLSHKVIDGVSGSTFLNSWAANAQGSCIERINPDLSEASLRFPPQDPSLLQNYISLTEKRVFKEGKYISKRFVFDAKAIATLRAIAKSDSVENPSRIETLSAFIWKFCMEAERVIYASSGPFLSSLAVNIRPRTEPCLPQYSIGNLWQRGITVCHDLTDTEMGLNELVTSIRETVTKMNADYLHTLQGENGFRVISKSLNKMSSNNYSPKVFVFSSWLRFGFNNIDFGWGKPVWVGVTGQSGQASFNQTIFSETGVENEIEVWMILEENIMSIIEHDPEFLKFALPNPSVLIP
ncbi:unnamed protein product [Dovyalis caffra]|uniref:Uncharacterized protein n=1 Tax=Dovyalis caffra TaxID=77055 RepID=A0AAV1R3H4_9ROSI|nr:unnamed protein product [Dovyalis caffra]